jgi:glycosyltransferase involved in cell wall biosynthesis
MPGDVPRIAWFSPLPPTQSGIADYTSEILPSFAGRASVDVFCPPGPFGRTRTAPGEARVLDHRRYPELRRSYDACFYHLGNNPHHEFVYLAAQRDPQIAVFHDVVLHHLVAWMTVESGRDGLGYERVLREEHGEVGGRLAKLKRLHRATDFEKFLFPLTGHVARRAKGLVVHSHDAAARLHDVAPEVPIGVIPHHAGPPPAEVAGIDRAEARRRLGLPPDAFVVAHLGFITKPKQPGAVLAGFLHLHRTFPNSVLTMVGADQTGGAVPALVDRLGLRESVRLAGYVDLPHLYLHLRAADVAINLRYPSAGETSGTLARALAEGRVVIVNNYGSWAELPRDVVMKVEIDAPQGDQVGEHLVHLARDPTLRERMEHAARRYASEHLRPSACAQKYLAFAAQVGSTSRTAPAQRGAAG